MKKLSKMMDHYRSIYANINIFLEAFECLTCFSTMSKLIMCFSIYKTPLEKLLSADFYGLLSHFLRIDCYKKIDKIFVK